MTQYARPDSDTANDGNWTGETTMSGEVLYTQIDEASADDDDYISGDDGSCGGVNCQVGLSDVDDPSSATNHKVYYRITDEDGSGSTLLVKLMQASTVIASQTTDLTEEFVTYNFTLSSTEANNISDYSNLRLDFTFTDDECMGLVGKISQAYFECPDAAAAAATSEAFLLFVD